VKHIGGEPGYENCEEPRAEESDEFDVEQRAVDTKEVKSSLVPMEEFEQRAEDSHDLDVGQRVLHTQEVKGAGLSDTPIPAGFAVEHSSSAGASGNRDVNLDVTRPLRPGDRVRFAGCTGTILREGHGVFDDSFRVDYDMHCWMPGSGTRDQWVFKCECVRMFDDT